METAITNNQAPSKAKRAAASLVRSLIITIIDIALIALFVVLVAKTASGEAGRVILILGALIMLVLGILHFAIRKWRNLWLFWMGFLDIMMGGYWIYLFIKLL